MNFNLQNQLSAATAKKLSPAAASASTMESAAPAAAPAAEAAAPAAEAMETAAAATDSAASAPDRKESEAEEMMDLEDKGNKVRSILGHGGWRQEGGRNRSGRGGDIDFGSRGGEELWASGGGKGGDRAQKFMKKGPKKELF